MTMRRRRCARDSLGARRRRGRRLRGREFVRVVWMPVASVCASGFPWPVVSASTSWWRRLDGRLAAVLWCRHRVGRRAGAAAHVVPGLRCRWVIYGAGRGGMTAAEPVMARRWLGVLCGVLGGGAGSAGDQTRRRFDGDVPVERDDAVEVVGLDDGVIGAHRRATRVAGGDGGAGGAGEDAVEAVHGISLPRVGRPAGS